MQVLTLLEPLKCCFQCAVRQKQVHFISTAYKGGCASREKTFPQNLKDPHRNKNLNRLVIKVDHANKHNSINLLPSGNAIKRSMKRGIALLFMRTIF